MDILDTIETHAAAMQLPLYAVTLTTVARKNTPAVLILHWHGLRRVTPLKIPGMELPWRCVPGSALHLRGGWDAMEEWDHAALDAAWQLGAWDLERVTHRPWWRLNAPQSETLDCYRAFGVYPDAGEAALTDEPDTDDQADQHDAPTNADETAELLELASMHGYVRWLFRPRACGLWSTVDDDDGSLGPGDRRAPPCPIGPAPFDRHKPGRRLYRLGHGTRIVT